MDEKGKPIPAYKPVAVDVGNPGVLRNGFREINQGIKPGDMVVAVGMQKIRLGKDSRGKDFLVKARPFDPERDSWTRPVARPAADSAGGSPVATAGATGKSLIGDSAAAPAVPAAGSPAGTPKQSSQRPGPAPAHSLTRAGNDSGSNNRRGR
jgi:multidrug efflux system membrane fusion protein